MVKSRLTMIAVIMLAGIFILPAVWAGSTVDDIFSMETKEITKRKKGPPKFKLVQFPHKKHTTDLKLACGACHHDKDNKPLDLNPGDDVQRCVACHTMVKKNKENKKNIMVLENAMHGKCVTCHKDTNKKAGDEKGLKGPAPATCGKCHISTKKK